MAEKKTNPFAIFIVVTIALVIFVSNVFGGSSSKVKTEADLFVAKTEQSSPIRLDISKTEDIIDYMNRPTSAMKRDGDKRKLVFSFDDNSSIIFVMLPASGGGLVLDYYYSE